ncbi:MAG: FKBP-type peptidyl-prolyl cis-trans isomerase [Pseudobdellovibrio sp.]
MEEVQITELKIGEGPEVSKGALCFAHYEGFLEDGTKFDSSYDHNRPFEFVTGSKKVIVGWSLACMGMRAGGERKVFVPASLAYGDRQIGQLIRPNSNLIYHIKMLEVRPRE